VLLKDVEELSAQYTHTHTHTQRNVFAFSQASIFYGACVIITSSLPVIIVNKLKKGICRFMDSAVSCPVMKRLVLDKVSPLTFTLPDLQGDKSHKHY